MVRNYIILFITICFIGSCGTIHQVPVKERETVVYRDSIVRVIDTIKVEIPQESVQNIVLDSDTSRLETSLARSTAYIDTISGHLFHNLENKDTFLLKKIEVNSKISYITTTKIVDVPIIQEKIKYRIPSWCWILLCVNLLFVGLKLGKLFKGRF